MTLGAGSRCQESTVITFEWDLMGLKEIFETSKDDEKSPLIASSLFGGGKWQLHFYASAARASSCSLYIAAIPTAEELRIGAQNCLSQGGWPRDGPHWARRGPFSFTFEIKSLDGTIPIVARGPHEPMVRREFTSGCSTWGYPQYVRRNEIFSDRAIAKTNNGVKIICTMTYPMSPLPVPPSMPAPPIYRTVSTDILDTVADLFDNPAHSDVVFRFPSTRGNSFRTIYASKRILARRSEYFRSLFEGGFAESTNAVAIGGFGMAPSSNTGRPLPNHSKLSSRITNPPPRLTVLADFDELDDDDSDADSDYDCESDAGGETEVVMDVELPRAASPTILSPRPCLPSEPRGMPSHGEELIRAMTPESLQSDSDDGADIVCPPVRTRRLVHPSSPGMQTIVIRDTAYLTYRALLFALYTDEITFAPLASTYHTDRSLAYKNETDFSYQTRRAYVRSRVPSPRTEAQKKAPFPSSPKALFKLADKLDLPRIKARCFVAIRESLNPRNVTTELFSDFSSTFPEVRRVEMDYMLSHWDEVSHTDGMMYDINPFSKSLNPYTPLSTARMRPMTARTQHRPTNANQDIFIQLLHSLRPKSRRNLKRSGADGMGELEDADDMLVESLRYGYEVQA